jgi:hypothetical protein
MENRENITKQNPSHSSLSDREVTGSHQLIEVNQFLICKVINNDNLC